MIAVLLITFSSTDYVDAASYDSKSTISFIKGKDQGLGDGSEGGSGTEDIPGGGIVDSGEASDGSGSAGNTLPKTATNMYSLLLLGIVIMVIGVAFLIYYSRKQKKKLNENKH